MSEQEEELLVEREFNLLKEAYLQSNHRRKIEIIERAYRFARSAHAGARRRSGEPYILHPIAVARIVISELGLGSTSICAALLHDVVEDTEYTREDIETAFGPKIAGIVEGLTKISGGIFGSQASLQAENFRKLLLSMSADIRVILIKMADRLHNMRTLGSLRPEKQFKIAGETLYVYAPLAHRLGLFKIKTELEDLAFRYEHPARYEEIMGKITESAGQRRAVVEEFVAPVREKLDASGYKYEIKARVKSAYSIFRKMEAKGIPFEEIYDVYAVRVIFDNDDDERERLRCWEVYTFFSDGHKLHPERLRDWTSVPKANGYRALHLTAMGPDGKWIEVQIRSRKMDEIAELGYAAHWKYKSGVTDEDTELDKWMNTVKDILAHPEPNSMDFLDTIKLNLFASEIYVFTPKGDLLTLPSGSTVLDMAFAIHSHLGAHCIAAKINHRLVSLDHPLDSGDQVEIITSETQTPKREWLDCCRSAKAKNRLRAILRKDRAAMCGHGKRLLDGFLEREGIAVSEQVKARILKNYRLGSMEDFYVRIATDEISLSPEEFRAANRKRLSTFRKMLRNPFSSRKRKTSPRLHYVSAHCCSPIPGDETVGFVDGSGTVTVHRIDCAEAMKLRSSRGSALVQGHLEQDAGGSAVRVAVEGIDRRGLLADITALLSVSLALDIDSMSLHASGGIVDCDFTLRVPSAQTLGTALARLKEIEGVRNAMRLNPGTDIPV